MPCPPDPQRASALNHIREYVREYGDHDGKRLAKLDGYRHIHKSTWHQWCKLVVWQAVTREQVDALEEAYNEALRGDDIDAMDAAQDVFLAAQDALNNQSVNSELPKKVTRNIVIDMTGKIIGKLRVISRSPKHNRYGAYWVCQCECGSDPVVVS